MIGRRLESNGRPHRGHGETGRVGVVLALRRLRKAMVINKNRFITCAPADVGRKHQRIALMSVLKVHGPMLNSLKKL